MDRRVKERLVGASILAVLVVLIVPELLSGPAPSTPATQAPASAPEPTRNVTVDLATRKPTQVEPAAPAAAEESSASAPSAAERAPSRPATQAPPRSAPSVVTMPAASPPPPPSHERPAPPASLERPAPSPTSSPGSKSSARSWAVQLGVFASRANADKLAREVKAQGFPVYVVSGGSGAGARHRVRCGPFSDRGAAAQALAKLQSIGHSGSLASPGT